MEKIKCFAGLLLHLVAWQNLFKQLSDRRSYYYYVHMISCDIASKGVAARGVQSGSVLCKHHNGYVSCADSTYTHGSFFTVYRRSKSGVLDSNKLKEQEALRPVLDVTLCISHITRYHMGYHGNVQKCAKTTGFMAVQTKRTYPTCVCTEECAETTGSLLKKQTTHYPHAEAVKNWLQPLHSRNIVNWSCAFFADVSGKLM